MSLEEGGSSSEQPIEGPAEEILPASEVIASDDDAKSLWNRRTLFKTAALGTAAAAMYEGGRAVFSPLVAYAHDLSDNPCTANDVRIDEPGVIINEPCPCNEPFTAVVAFQVFNNTNTGRYCVALHLVPSPGVPLPGDNGDLVLHLNPDGSGGSTLPPNGTTTMYATIPNWPCGLGRVCFGQAGTVRGRCDPGTCSTVAWNTSPNAAGCASPDQSPSPGQCRHQQICIIGRGVTTLDCDLVATGVQDTCSVVCGTSTMVQLCTTSPASFGPFTFTLSDGQSFGPTTDTCHTFTVGPISAQTTITGTITDSTGCASSDSVTLNTTAPVASIVVSDTAECDGVLTLTASVTSGVNCVFTWSDGVVGASRPYGPVLDGVCHTISVTADCDGECDATASVNISQCVTTVVGCTPPPPTP
jgi:hypothetical protein